MISGHGCLRFPIKYISDLYIFGIYNTVCSKIKIVDKNMMLTDSDSNVGTEGICKQTFYVELYFQEF